MRNMIIFQAIPINGIDRNQHYRECVSVFLMSTTYYGIFFYRLTILMQLFEFNS